MRKKTRGSGRYKEVFLCECGLEALRMYTKIKDSVYRLYGFYYCPHCNIILKKKLVKFETKKLKNEK